ncbi:MAG: hypothetical protein JW938_04535 [Candidatus Omnitrophica bacterium]|nr:hypothetical protein [Candidatus Omnitrophota bacterium]
MSIIYEALKKADNEIKGKPVDIRDTKKHKDFVTAFKTLEAQQKSAIHERIKTSIVPERSIRNKFLHSIVIIALLFAVTGIALYYFYFNNNFLFLTGSQVVDKNVTEVVAQPVVRDVVVTPPQASPVKPVQRDVVVQPVTPLRDVIRRRIDTRNEYYARPGDTEPLFVCSGIIIEPNERYCFLNGVIMRVGESFDGARVLAIYDREVVLEYRGKKISLLLPASKQNNDNTGKVSK